MVTFVLTAPSRPVRPARAVRACGPRGLRLHGTRPTTRWRRATSTGPGGSASRSSRWGPSPRPTRVCGLRLRHQAGTPDCNPIPITTDNAGIGRGLQPFRRSVRRCRRQINVSQWHRLHRGRRSRSTTSAGSAGSILRQRPVRYDARPGPSPTRRPVSRCFACATSVTFTVNWAGGDADPVSAVLMHDHVLNRSTCSTRSTESGPTGWSPSRPSGHHSETGTGRAKAAGACSSAASTTAPAPATTRRRVTITIAKRGRPRRRSPSRRRCRRLATRSAGSGEH